MHPILDLGFVELRTFGLVMVVAFAAALALAEWRARARGFAKGTMVAAAIPVIGGAWLGARIVPMLVDPAAAFASPETLLRGLALSGGAFYGGLAGGLAGLFFFSRRRKIALPSLLDAVAPAIPLGQSIGRLACLFAGCDHGRPAGDEFPFAIVYSDPRSLVEAGLLGVPLHAAPLYEAAGSVVVLALLLAAERRIGFGSGRLFRLYAFVYACLRLGVEPFRGDASRGLFLDGRFSTSTILSLAILAALAALALAARLRRHSTATPPSIRESAIPS